MEQPKDIIQHETRTKFNLRRRLLILMGGDVVVNSEIFTAETVTVLFSKAIDRIEGGFINKIKRLWQRQRG